MLIHRNFGLTTHTRLQSPRAHREWFWPVVAFAGVCLAALFAMS